MSVPPPKDNSEDIYPLDLSHFHISLVAMAEALRYKDKVTLVTGGSRGIGRGCVEVFGEYEFFMNCNFITESSPC